MTLEVIYLSLHQDLIDHLMNLKNHQFEVVLALEVYLLWSESLLYLPLHLLILHLSHLFPLVNLMDYY